MRHFHIYQEKKDHLFMSSLAKLPQLYIDIEKLSLGSNYLKETTLFRTIKLELVKYKTIKRIRNRAFLFKY